MSDSRGRLRGLLLACGLGLALGSLAFLTARFDLHPVTSIAMAPTLTPGDRVAVRAVRGGQVERDEIVELTAPWPGLEGGPTLTFRIAAVAGDHVTRAADGVLRVNGRPVLGPRDAVRPVKPFTVTVPAGRVFVTGDAGDLAADSLLHLDLAGGTVTTTAITGRVVATAWPWQRAGAPGLSTQARLRWLLLPFGGKDQDWRLGSLGVAIGALITASSALRLVNRWRRRAASASSRPSGP